MYHKYRDGYLEVITGCMFAGKTEDLIRRIKVLEFAKKKVLVFKPTIDDRYSKTMVVSHGGSSVNSILVDKAKDILDYIDETVDVVAIDEVQFFDHDIIHVCDILCSQGKRVMVAGLDTDFRAEPFGDMAYLITMTEFLIKFTVVFTKCGAPATRTQRIVNGKPASYHDPIIMVGASESYEARCRHCFEMPDKPTIK